MEREKKKSDQRVSIRMESKRQSQRPFPTKVTTGARGRKWCLEGKLQTARDPHGDGSDWVQERNPPYPSPGTRRPPTLRQKAARRHEDLGRGWWGWGGGGMWVCVEGEGMWVWVEGGRGSGKRGGRRVI